MRCHAPQTRLLLRALLTASVSLVWSQNAAAEPYCPGTYRTVVFNGAWVGGPVTGQHLLSSDPDLNKRMHPCDMFWVEVQATDSGPDMYGTAFSLELRNLNNTPINTISFSVPPNQTNSGTFPSIPNYWGKEGKYFGTAFPVNLLDVLNVSTNAVDSGLSYTITVHLIARPGYNRGGTSIAAPFIVQNTDVTFLGTLATNQQQYHKVTLPPGGRVTVFGTLSNWHPTHPTYYRTRFYNAGWTLLKQQYVTVLENSTDFPFVNHFYLNTGPLPMDVYVAFLQYVTSAWVDFRITLQVDGLPPPQLKLFLEADEPLSFNLSNPAADDDSTNYVPGSKLATGLGESISVMETTGQAVELIAAFVDASGQIVAAPGTGDVTFDLTDVSAFTGIAMNYGTDPGPDFELSGPACTGGPGWCVAFGTDNTARITLLAKDYGGFATVTAQRGASSASFRLPKDGNNVNWLPEAGWHVFDTFGQDQGVVPDDGSVGDDLDSTAGNVFVGDGLSQFEEFRGFVTGGIHVRTNPTDKDVFVFSQFFGIGVGDAATLPVTVHQLSDVELDGYRRIAPNYQNAGSGGSIPGHFFGTLASGGQSEQLAIIVFNNDTVTSPLTAQGFGYTQNQEVSPNNYVPGPPWTVGPLASGVYSVVIRVLSPTHDDQTTPDAFDQEKTAQTIAHEIGHNLGMYDVQHFPVDTCLPIADTVMIIKYFPGNNPPKNPDGSPNCAWYYIPHWYTSVNLNQLQVR